MEVAQSFLGIDVSKLKLDVALLANGKVKSKVLDNSPAGYVSLLEWIAKSRVDMESMYFCMEATGVYYEALALALHDADLKVSVVNPSCIKGFGRSENIRNKNDAIDAGLIARYCAAMKPALWDPLPLGATPVARLVDAGSVLEGYSPARREPSRSPRCQLDA